MESYDTVETITSKSSSCANCTKGTRARGGILLWAFLTADKGQSLVIDQLRGGGYSHRAGTWHRVCRACAPMFSVTEERFIPNWGKVDDATVGLPSRSDVPSLDTLTSDPVEDMNLCMEAVKDAKVDMERARTSLSQYEDTLRELRAVLSASTARYEQAKQAYSRAAKRLADTF